nr:EAL domain-containing response regulator [uncultured Dongia sp.]
MSTASTQNLPLLIVMDTDPEMRAFVRHSGEASGFAVEEAVNHDALLAAMTVATPAILVLDLQLATMQGVETMRALVDRRATAKIVLFCGSDMRALKNTRLVARSLGLQIAAIQQKPARQNDLTEQLMRLRLTHGTFSAETLRQCLDQDLISVHYQPKLSLDTFEITGVEALLRCRTIEGQMIPPEQVVEAAEETSMIDELTERVFQKALQQRQVWSKWGVDLDISVNLSARCSFDNRFPEILADLCRDADMPTNAVTIELTETAVMSGKSVSIDAIQRLREKGFLLSIDDFGTGYSSLVRLKQLPFSEIKIDRSFVTDLHGSRDNGVIVTTIVALAQGMEMRCVIEGVEDEEALLFAARLGCHEAQGYFIARPMAGDDVRGFLKSWTARRDALLASLASEALELGLAGLGRSTQSPHGRTIQHRPH